MASKGKAPAEASPTRARVDKKGKKVAQTPSPRASARLAALETRTLPTPPPTSSTPAMSQPAVKKPIFIVDQGHDLGFPSSPSSSSEEDDVLENDLGFWDYEDLDDWEPQNQMLVPRQVAPAIFHQTIRLAHHAWCTEDRAYFKVWDGRILQLSQTIWILGIEKRLEKAKKSIGSKGFMTRNQEGKNVASDVASKQASNIVASQCCSHNSGWLH
ncbi:hypothetical protein PIB30_090794 [Stylosanthes scabra]|uniref:Uncharacterized protein n=1 Tax=Stylosanthes scabra TaxID=79078 RepID=A0ABU6ZT05_9FABA|nr:hypothetical protein [Stylosanthes scabra]